MTTYSWDFKVPGSEAREGVEILHAEDERGGWVVGGASIVFNAEKDRWDVGIYVRKGDVAGATLQEMEKRIGEPLHWVDYGGGNGHERGYLVCGAKESRQDRTPEGDPLMDVTLERVAEMTNTYCYNMIIFDGAQGIFQKREGPSLMDSVKGSGNMTFGDMARKLLEPEAKLVREWLRTTKGNPEALVKWLHTNLEKDGMAEVDKASTLFRYKAAIHIVTEGNHEKSTVRVRHDGVDGKLDSSGEAARRQPGDSYPRRRFGLRSGLSRLWRLLRRRFDDSGQRKP